MNGAVQTVACAPRCLALTTSCAGTAADFLDWNGGEYRCLAALLARSGLGDALTMDSLANTYFFPTDNAFLTDLSVG